jgi:bis(5'-nucleosyl)-tetraphosphatase (symmetrical)
MITYVIGDVRGNFQALEQFLDQIEFDQAQDTLWFTGNLIGGGGDSLAVLQFVQGLGTRAVSVLGEEELRLLAVAQGVQVPGDETAFDDILAATDSDALLTWLRQRSFLHHEHGYTLVHAGIPAEWSLSQAKVLAMEAETSLSMAGQAFFENIFGDPPPPRWHAKHRGWRRVRFIVHAFTRMRYYNDKGRVYFSSADSDGMATKDLIPWYWMADRAMAHQKIIFGHGSFSYNNKPDSGPDSGVVPGIYALGAGSGAEGSLNAMKIPTQQRKAASA